MSFKYRVIGYSPQYAVTDTGTNDFHNVNNITSGSQLNILSGGSLVINSGSTATVPTAASGNSSTTIANTAFVDTYFLKKTGGSVTGSLSLSAALTIGTNFDQSGSSGTFATGTGSVTINGNATVSAGKTLTLSGAPTLDLHAATKKYVDDLGVTKLSLSGGTMTGQIILPAGPTLPLHAATMSYVDAKLGTFDAGDGLYVTPLNTSKSGTYSQSGTTITVTIANHGLAFGSTVVFTFTGSPKPADGSYSVMSVTGPNTFTVTSGTSQTASGNAAFNQTTNQVAIRSTTLTATTDDLNLTAINTNGGNFSGGGSYVAGTWYTEFQVDTYGRVTSGKKTTITSTNGDGWYNSVKLQGGYITGLSNNNYLLQNDPIAVTSTDLMGSTTYASGACVMTLNLVDKVTPGTYSKVSVNSKGLVTNVANISASDITSALGYTPLKDSQAYLTYYKGSFASTSWGTGPISLTYNSGYNGYTVNGTYLYLPKGIYMLTFWGANNWYSWYYNYWGWYWWSSYWSYYYNPAVIYHNGKIVSSAFANYGGWWWYYNSSFKSDVSQDFLMTNVIEITKDNEYVQFGVPHLSGVTFWYNIKILKLK